MGQNLSCVSKNNSAEGVRRKDKKTKGKVLVAGDDQIKAESSNQQESAAPEEVSFLESAPSSFALPSVVPACKKAKDGTHIQASPEVTATSKRPNHEAVNSVARVHVEQPVDGHARRLAQGKAKPTCWRDLYWHLVGSRGFKTEEEKLRALFTWLCSMPPDLSPFPNLSAKSEGHKDKNKGKQNVDSPDVLLPKLSEGKANYVQVSVI